MIFSLLTCREIGFGINYDFLQQGPWKGSTAKVKGLPPKDLMLEPPLLPRLFSVPQLVEDWVLLFLAALLALAFEYLTLGEIGTNYQLTGWLAVWSGVACGSGIIIGAKRSCKIQQILKLNNG